MQKFGEKMWKFGVNLDENIWKFGKKFGNLRIYFGNLDKNWKLGQNLETIWKYGKHLKILKKKWKFGIHFRNWSEFRNLEKIQEKFRNLEKKIRNLKIFWKFGKKN